MHVDLRASCKLCQSQKGANLDLDLAKMEYTQSCSSKKKKARKWKDKSRNPYADPEAVPYALAVAKTTHEKALKTAKATKLTAPMVGVRPLNCMEISTLTKPGRH